VVQIVVQIAFVVQIVVQILKPPDHMEKPTLTYFFDLFPLFLMMYNRFSSKGTIIGRLLLLVVRLVLARLNYEKHIQALNDEGRISTARSYQDSLTSMLSYKKNLKVSQITPDFLKGYEKWMTDNGRSLTTVGMYVRALRTIFNMAIENEVIDASKYPFKKYTIPAPQKISRTLKKEEIRQIINYTAKRDADAVALDYWVFSFISNGMNFKDIALLKYGNINGDFLEFRRAKTKRTTNNNSLPIMVPLDENLLYIIKKRGNKSKKY